MAKEKKVEHRDPPVNVAIPTTIPEKMKAIVNLSQSILELSRAINSTNVYVNVGHNKIITPNGEIGINIKTE